LDILVFCAMTDIQRWEISRMNTPEALGLIHSMCMDVRALLESPILLETFTWIASDRVPKEAVKALSYAGALWRPGTHSWHDDGNYCYAVLFWTLHYMVDRVTPVGQALSAVQERYHSLHSAYTTFDSHKSWEFAGDILECLLANSIVRDPMSSHVDVQIKHHAHQLMLGFCDTWLELADLMGEYCPYRYRPSPIEVVGVFYRYTIHPGFPNGSATETQIRALPDGTLTAVIVELEPDGSRWF
jgi:hypothetical protein